MLGASLVMVINKVWEQMMNGGVGFARGGVVLVGFCTPLGFLPDNLPSLLLLAALCWVLCPGLSFVADLLLVPQCCLPLSFLRCRSLMLLAPPIVSYVLLVLERNAVVCGPLFLCR